MPSIASRLGDALRRFIPERKEESDRGVLDALRTIDLFHDLSRGQLRDLADLLHLRTYRREEYLYYEDDPGLGLYIIKRGCVRLLTEDSEGRVHELRHACDGEIVGLISLLGDFHRMETVQAVMETEVLGLFRPDMKALIKKRPKTAVALLESFSRSVTAEHTTILDRLMRRDGKVDALHLVHEGDAAHESYARRIARRKVSGGST